MITTQIFRIRSGKRFQEMDRKIVNDFKKDVIIKNCRWVRESYHNYVDEIYTYEEKEDSKYYRDRLYLYEKIRNWRLWKSREEEFFEYEVLRDTHIDSLIDHRPSTVKELRKIKGFKKNRVKKYGKEILSILNSI